MALELIAPAKINLTLEVLGKRNDGYHEIASVMQTIALFDSLRIEPSASIELILKGEEGRALPADTEANLVFRAAVALREAAGHPGLGGGSSDAAAALRGLNRLWSLDLDTPRLLPIAAGLGSDVPFFLLGGTALVTGRGEKVEPLPDLAPDSAPFVFTLLWPEGGPEPKTAQMYAALEAGDFSDGSRTSSLAGRLQRAGAPDVDELYNAFDRAVAIVSPLVRDHLSALRAAGISAIVCGSGPTVLAAASAAQVVAAMPLGFEGRLSEYSSLSRQEALRYWQH